MGSRAANQPKNTWSGNNVISNANGELIPTGTRTVTTFAGVTSTAGAIAGHLYDQTFGYIFAAYGTSTRMLRYTHTDGTTFPNTITAYTTSGQIYSNVTYTGLTQLFYYSAVDGNVYGISSSGATSSTQAVGQRLDIIRAYKLRLVGISFNNPNRLLYSGVYGGSGFGAWTSGQYYEFNSPIYQIYPRTDDLLVVCGDGVYSLTGVLGSGVNIQLLSPMENISTGMSRGAIVNRSLFFVDNPALSGSVDGRLYRFIGATIQNVASFEYGDYPFNDNGRRPGTSAVISPIANGRLAVQFRNGTTYFETTSGTFAKSKVWTLNEGAAEAASNTFRIAEPLERVPEEYILTAVVDRTNTSSPISVYRTIVNVPGPTKLDANFSTASSTCTVNPSGTVELSEYWHNKPFTVKEAFVEYSITTGGSVSCTIVPTGVVDVPEANLASVVSTTASETSPPAGGYRMYRYWPNNAAKGFGVKPQLTITNCFVKRVILNCED